MKMIIKTVRQKIKLWVQPENSLESRAIAKVGSDFCTTTHKDAKGKPYLEISFSATYGTGAALRALISILKILEGKA